MVFTEIFFVLLYEVIWLELNHVSVWFLVCLYEMFQPPEKVSDYTPTSLLQSPLENCDSPASPRWPLQRGSTECNLKKKTGEFSNEYITSFSHRVSLILLD